MNRVALAFTVLALGSAASHAAPQQLTRCVAGQEVTDKEGKSGVIVADDTKRQESECQGHSVHDLPTPRGQCRACLEDTAWQRNAMVIMIYGPLVIHDKCRRTPTMSAAIASSSLPRALLRHSASPRSRQNALAAAPSMKWPPEQIRSMRSARPAGRVPPARA